MRTAKIGPDLRLQISAPYTLYPTKGSQQAPVLSYDLHDRHLRMALSHFCYLPSL